MKIKIFILFAAMFLVAFTSADEFRKVENKAFGVGEKLTFNVNYSFATVGIASFSIPEIKTFSKRKCYRIKFEVNTVPSFDLFFKVRDLYESYLDVEGIFPWRFEQHIREGKFSRDFSAFFDQRKNKAKTTEGEYDIPKYVHDIVSAFYYVRTMDLSKMKKGERFNLKNFYRNKTHELDVIYHGRETVEVPAGKFDCLIVEPLVKEGGLFKHEGNILIWLTNDEAKVPVKVRTKIIIGYVESELTNYENIKAPLKSKQ
ncbi:MAG: DUF3108 domain-containing protein [Ignavibacteria bacterium]|nr:DUF3108 domain-containing protein [Ignavibacteria bacterium]